MKLQKKIGISKAQVSKLFQTNQIDQSANAKPNQAVMDQYSQYCKDYGQSFSYGGKFFVKNVHQKELYEHYAFLQIVEKDWYVNNFEYMNDRFSKRQA